MATKGQALKLAAGLVGAYAAARGWRSVATELRSRRLPRGTRFVILGAGFGGVSAALELARLLPRRELGEIQLVDEQPFLLFTPMLTEVAGGELDARHVVAPPHSLSRRITFVRGRVEKIDIANRRVTVNLGDSTRTLEADHLVLALGSVNNYHHIPGLDTHSLTIKGVEEAVAIRNRVLALIERASIEPNEESRREMLTFVTGGGGYTGVETMAAVNDLARTAARAPGIPPDNIQSILIEPGDRLMPETSPELAGYARRKLEERGVKVMLRTKITGAGEGWVDLSGSVRIQARTLVWAGGVQPNPLIASLDCKKGKHGGVVANESCEIPGHPGIWALGDCAEVPEEHTGHPYAPTAQNATREGRHAAQNIVREMLGEPLRPFRYRPLGELALVGRHEGIARIYGMEFSGLSAWALWRAVYLSKMPVMSQRFRIAFDWLLDLAFGRNLAAAPGEEITYTRSKKHEDHGIGPAHSAAG